MTSDNNHHNHIENIIEAKCLQRNIEQWINSPTFDTMETATWLMDNCDLGANESTRLIDHVLHLRGDPGVPILKVQSAAELAAIELQPEPFVETERAFKFDFEEAILADTDLSAGSKHLAQVYAYYMNHSKYPHESWPSVPRLERDMAKGRSMIAEYKKELIVRGFVVPRRTPRRPNNVLCVVPDRAWAEALERREEDKTRRAAK